jgi:hypothetical protein
MRTNRIRCIIATLIAAMTILLPLAVVAVNSSYPTIEHLYVFAVYCAGIAMISHRSFPKGEG